MNLYYYLSKNGSNMIFVSFEKSPYGTEYREINIDKLEKCFNEYNKLNGNRKYQFHFCELNGFYNNFNDLKRDILIYQMSIRKD